MIAPLAPALAALVRDAEPVHGWFGLTYANYYVMPRAILQSAPIATQRRFVALASELSRLFNLSELLPPGGYRVQALTTGGRFTTNPCPHYDRGRTRVPLRAGEA
jgi:hypothetical protein